jgi:hypothetical protein
VEFASLAEGLPNAVLAGLVLELVLENHLRDGLLGGV